MFDLKAYRQQYYLEHRTELRAKALENYHNDPERHRGYCRKWRKKYPEKALSCRTSWRLRNPEKERAQLNANRKVPLASCCADCGSVGDLERHHPDYSKPLEVVTLCPTCHKQRHMREQKK